MGKTFTFYAIYKSSINELMCRDSCPCSCWLNALPFQHIYQRFCARDSSGDTLFTSAVSAHQVALLSWRAFSPMPRAYPNADKSPTQRQPHLAAITVSKEKPFIIQYVDISPQTVANKQWRHIGGWLFIRPCKHDRIVTVNPIFIKFGAEQ